MCEYCSKNKNKKLLGIEVIFKYDNPEAYGYPEIVYYNNKVELDYCPMCGRKLTK